MRFAKAAMMAGTCMCAGGLGCGGAAPSAPEPAIVAQRPAPPAPLEQSVAEEGEGLSEADIRPVVEASYGQVRGCHSLEYSGSETKPGSVVVDMEIRTDGSVAAASVADSSFDSRQMHECVLGVTRSLQFPPADGPTDLSWRFKFRASSAEVAQRR